MSYSPLQVGPGTVVCLHYKVYDEEGDLLQRTEPEAPLTYLHGYGQLVHGLERELEGLVEGQRKEVILRSEEAYGAYDPQGRFELSRDEFPATETIDVNDEFVLEDAKGETTIVRVIDVQDDAFLVDTNHPLAGQTLRFDVIISGVRVANRTEMDHAEQALMALDKIDAGPWVPVQDSSSADLLPIDRLLLPRASRLA